MPEVFVLAAAASAMFVTAIVLLVVVREIWGSDTLLAVMILAGMVLILALAAYAAFDIYALLVA